MDDTKVQIPSDFCSPAEIVLLLEKLGDITNNYKTDFFKDGNALLNSCKKFGVSREIDTPDENSNKDLIDCPVPNCNQHFVSIRKYEDHYNSQHRISCSQCRKVLPTYHILDLHLMEAHDSYFSVLSERQPMFSCFLPNCSHMSRNTAERKDHCIREHKFPHTFQFETFKKSDKNRNIKRDKLNTTLEESPMVDDTSEMCEQFSKSMQIGKKKFYTFGHSQTKTFEFDKKKKGVKQINDIASCSRSTDKMIDIEDS